jgi:asparagine synthase (glutamine-hydrolysing)
VCGIAGVVALGDRPIEPGWGATLLEALSHRGPDGHGVFCEGKVLLAHTRLAILDLSSAGEQPMHSASDRHVLIHNGEVYNYRDLVPALEARGVRLRSRSDTEVVLESLALDGPAAMGRFRGMWADAFWDRDRQELLLTRDRLGKKPIVWTRTPDYFAFASEARTLLQLPFVRARLDRRALPHYLQQLYVPAPYTLLEGVRKLPAASWMRVRPGSAPEEPVRWWQLPEPNRAAHADAAWFEGFDADLIEATRLRTVSDVPVGVFLSGGVDSNVVLEALYRGGHRPIHTFTLGFHGLADERPLAAPGAKRFADSHVELVITPDLVPDIEAALAGFADPLGDSAVVTNALIAREAAKHVKVILNGDGGDELFGGYARYPFARRADWARRVPGADLVLRQRYGGRPNAMAALEALGRSQPLEAAAALGGVLSPQSLPNLLAPESPAAHRLAPPSFPGACGPGLVDALFAWDTGRYLPDDLLVKVDVASMAYALENRSPLLDHLLFERVAALPPARRVDGLQTKPLLKHHAQGRIAREVLAASKRGFALPLEQWLRGPLAPWLDRLLAPPQATASLFREGVIAREREAFRTGRADELAAIRLWSLAALEFWARTFGVEIGG